MTNLDSTWQASVIKLAQSGNSRAIAFWLNRYLVPQGICAQVETHPSDGLLLRVVCRQVPDGDRLVRFICHRLCKLDSPAIQRVQITAQMVGSPQILWQKSARIIPPSERQNRQQSTGNVYAFPQSAQAPTTSTVTTASSEHAPQPAGSNRSSQLGLRFRCLPTHWASISRFWQKPGQKTGQRSGPSATQIQFSLSNLQTTALDLTDRSIHWFMQQKPTTRAVMLGGSAVAAFLLGCSFELAGYYANPSTFQQSKATLTRMLRSSAVLTGSVKTSSERIPVIQQPVLNPDDPTVSLIFTNSATLTRVPTSQLTPAPVSPSPVPLVTTIESYRLADMIVTNLNNPLGPTASEQPAEQKSQTEGQTSQAESLPKATEESEALSADAEPDAEPNMRANPEEDGLAPTDEMVLTGLPEDDTTDGLTGSDSEIERAKYATENSDGSEAGAEQAAAEDASRLRRKSKPLMPQELLANGIDVVNVASNAVVVEGIDPLTQTLELLKQNGIYAVGAGEDLPSARRPQIFDVKGQRIAYLGYSDSATRPVSAGTAGINVGVSQQMEEDIKAIRDQVDWIVVSLNWNRELRAYPEEWQVKLAHAAIDQGADLVVGYDANVTQGAEIYNGRPIVYSLGSSVDEYNDKPAGNYDTVALKVSLKEHMMELEFLPIQVKRGQAEVAKGELQKTLLQYMEQASSLFDHPLRSSTSLNSQLRLSLPSAPDAEMQTDPFINYPESPAATEAKPQEPQ